MNKCLRNRVRGGILFNDCNYPLIYDHRVKLLSAYNSTQDSLFHMIPSLLPSPNLDLLYNRRAGGPLLYV